MLRFEPADPARDEVARLLDEHLADVGLASPPGSIHALTGSQLADPAIAFWTAWDGPQLQACAALKPLPDGSVELKTMRTVPSARRRGVGSALLDHLLGIAADRGHRRVLLETGAQEFFAPARRLYARHGFVPCEPFADYRPDPNSVFMERTLGADDDVEHARRAGSK